MINDLDIPKSDLWQYADDTTISETVSQVSNIQNAVDTFSTNTSVDKFKLNKQKYRALH